MKNYYLTEKTLLNIIHDDMLSEQGYRKVKEVYIE